MPTLTTRRRYRRSQVLTRPNVVLIFTDDQPADRINSEVMPYLASEPEGHWVKFPRAICSTPLCGPNRATMFTGQTWQRHGVKNHLHGQLQNLNEAEALPVVLSDAGYRTGLFGKYENDWPDYQPAPLDLGYVPAGWDSFWGTTTSSGTYFDWAAHTNIPGAPTSGATAEADYHVDRLAALAADFIAADDARPFFAMLTPGSPHTPPVPAPRHAALSLPSVATDPPDFNVVNSGAPAWAAALGPLTTDHQNNVRARRLEAARCLRSVDEMIETAIEAVKTAGKLDNTVIIVATDNTVMEGRKRMSSPAPGPAVDKRVPYYASLDAQLRVRYPGATARTDLTPLASVDIPVSVAHWAGGTWAHGVDGSRHLAEVTLDTPGAVRRPSAYATYEAGSPVPQWEGILRADGIKYVHWAASGEFEVYDTVADPYEQTNLYGADPTRDAACATELAQHQADRTFWEA